MKAWKIIQAWIHGIQTHDLCNTGGVLNHNAAEKKWSPVHHIIFWGILGLKTWWFAGSVNKQNTQQLGNL